MSTNLKSRNKNISLCEFSGKNKRLLQILTKSFYNDTQVDYDAIRIDRKQAKKLAVDLILWTNNRLKEISKQNNIKYINAELFFCNHEKKECLVRLDDFNEIYRDYGRHSMPGLKLMGSMISKDFF